MKYTKNQIEEALAYWNRQQKELMLEDAKLDAEVDKTEKEAQIAMNKLTIAQSKHDIEALEGNDVGEGRGQLNLTEPDIDEAEDVDEADVPMQSEEDFFGKIDDPINDIPPTPGIQRSETPEDSEAEPEEEKPIPEEELDEALFDKLFGKDYAPNTVGAVIKLFKSKFKMEDKIIFTVKPENRECVMIDVNRKGDKFAFVDLGEGQPD